ncbi:hypothetical protein PHMEG_00029219 [Phytophthora megakarya]|uniref:Uncharacterized protein n=1 Tax=Phytophthora megakarya TaxID=4795 RepID=A0A225V3S0_9STRA|nr:hypothetical protein PHMEG_00029219 [Phytophthora megakarya]
MGAGPSLGKFLKCMDDEDLIKLFESAYKLEPQRMEKMFTLAKMRYYEDNGHDPPREVDAVDTAAALSLSTALLQPPQSSAPSAGPPMLNEMLSSHSTTTSTTASMHTVTTADDHQSVLNGDKDMMNALWSFEGHHLRKMQTAKKNQESTDQSTCKSEDRTDSGTQDNSPRELDADGYPIMYGSCGRDKRYGRCSVCYFRGLRCNTDHYCACCQRAVCIRPRKYPGEENQKICWNVLHMDKEIVKRVQRKKKRKLHATTATTSGSAARMRNTGTYHTDTGHHDRPNDSLSHSVVDLHRTPSIPTVVADVSGAVDL